MITEYIIAVIIASFSALLLWAYRRKTFWSRHNVPYIPSLPLVGNIFKSFFLQEQILHTLDHLYYHPAAHDQPFVGINIFQKPTIFIRDPELVKRVLVRDFNYFSDRAAGGELRHDPVGAKNLFQLNNPLWKTIRTKLSPIFTSGKMKQMYYLVERVGETLNQKCHEIANGNNLTIGDDVRDLFQCFTVDAICLVAFATEAGCLEDLSKSEFFQNARDSLMDTTWNKLGFNTVFFMPELIPWGRFKTFSVGFERFLRRLFRQVMDNRIASGAVRNDLIDALISIKKADEELFKDEDLLLGQAAVFFVAGFETSSSTLAFTTYELARNPETQEKLRAEIKAALEENEGKLTYEVLMNKMPYLTWAIMETLRLYPILSFLGRICTPPAGQDGYSLEPYSKFKIPRGMDVYIPASALQRDPKYFPEPEKYKPERFDKESSTYNEYTYMPFGLGPHNCIGERFGMMQVKMGLVSVLRSFRLELDAETARKPMELDPSMTFLRSKYPIKVKYIRDELYAEKK